MYVCNRVHTQTTYLFSFSKLQHVKGHTGCVVVCILCSLCVRWRACMQRCKMSCMHICVHRCRLNCKTERFPLTGMQQRHGAPSLHFICSMLATHLLCTPGARCQESTFDGERCVYAALNDRIRHVLRQFKTVRARDPWRYVSSCPRLFNALQHKNT